MLGIVLATSVVLRPKEKGFIVPKIPKDKGLPAVFADWVVLTHLTWDVKQTAHTGSHQATCSCMFKAKE